MQTYKRNTGVKRNRDEVFSWYKEHLEGLCVGKISKKYNTDAGYQFKKYNFKTIDLSTINRTSCIKILNNFSTIKTEEDAYILGLLFSDGYISKNTAGINLQKKDIDILEKIKKYISPESSIKIDRTKSNSFSLKFHSKVLVQNLIKIGLNYNKTYGDFNIPIMEEGLKRHFIRGYFDGDGSVFFDRQYIRINICSINMNILTDFGSIFKENNIDFKINTEIRENKCLKLPSGKTTLTSKNMHRIFIRKKSDIIKIHDFFYRNSTIFLDRKFLKLNEYVNTELNKQITQGCLSV